MSESRETDNLNLCEERLSRTAMLVGEAGVNRLRRAHVAVFGLGGVGGYAVEALARGGIGTLTLVDHDVVSASNLNRQILATTENLGQKKTDAAKTRVKIIAPDCKVILRDLFFLPENAAEFDFSAYDYVVDCVDTVTAKIALIEEAKKAGVPVLSCMGTGNKFRSDLFRVADIEKTEVCPLAKVLRKELRDRNIRHVKVVYSPEIPVKTGERTPGSTSFVPGAAGLLMAGTVIQDLLAEKTAE